jgi:hypothetical protein
MSTIDPGDLFQVMQAGVSYQLNAGSLASRIQTMDGANPFLTCRGTTHYQVSAASLCQYCLGNASSVQDSDLYLIERGGVQHQVTAGTIKTYTNIAEEIVHISANVNGVNAAGLFASWGANKNKRLIIDPGVTVGGLYIPGGAGGSTFIMENNGAILGAGGGGNSGGGGTAFTLENPLTIYNNGTIAGGGGGGGVGGPGGGGAVPFDCSYYINKSQGLCIGYDNLNDSCVQMYGAGHVCTGGGTRCRIGNCTNCGWACVTCAQYVPQTCYNYTGGGAGGAGGRGAGFDGGAAGGAGGAPPDVNAGWGGTGGAGGQLGQWGATGDTGGSGNNGGGGPGAGGGPPGYYIVGNGYATWAVSGNLAGQVG